MRIRPTLIPAICAALLALGCGGSGSGSTTTTTTTTSGNGGIGGNSGGTNTSGGSSSTTSTSTTSGSATTSSGSSSSTTTSSTTSTTSSTTSSGSTSSSSSGSSGTTSSNVCAQGCPSGYSCVSGACQGGPDTGLTFDVETITVSGNVTQNGTTPQTCSYTYDTGYLDFTDVNTGATFSVAVYCGSDWHFSVDLYPGTYQVQARVDQSAPMMTVAGALPLVTATAGLTFDVQTVTAAGALTQNGAMPQTCSYTYDTGYLDFTDTSSGASFSVAVYCGSDWHFSANLYPGTYRVQARIDQSAPMEIVAASMTISANTSGLTYDVRTYAVSGALTQNGATPPTCSYTYDTGYLDFTDTASGASFSVPVYCGSDWHYTANLYPGTYKVQARVDQSSAMATVVSALSVQGALSGQNFDVQTVSVSGNLTQNGAMPQTCSYTYDTGYLDFTDVSTGGSFSVPVYCGSDWHFTASLYPGTYRVEARVDQGAPMKVVAPSLSIQGNTPGLTFDLATVTAAGSLTHNGSMPQTCSYTYDTGYLDFTDTTSGATFSVPVYCGSDWHFSAALYPGTYQVQARIDQSAPMKIVNDSLSVQSSASGLTFDIATVTVSGALTQNHAMPTTCSYTYDTGYLELTDTSSGGTFSVPVYCGSDWHFSADVYAGTYKVQARVDQGAPMSTLYDALTFQ